MDVMLYLCTVFFVLAQIMMTLILICALISIGAWLWRDMWQSAPKRDMGMSRVVYWKRKRYR